VRWASSGGEHSSAATFGVRGARGGGELGGVVWRGGGGGCLI
jgi:hypothetical protein